MLAIVTGLVFILMDTARVCATLGCNGETMLGNEVATRVLATSDADETDGTGTNSTQGCEIMFQKG